MSFVDPACGMTVGEEDAPRDTFEGVEYRFCCEMCRFAFIGNPERYLSPTSRPHATGEGRVDSRDLLQADKGAASGRKLRLRRLGLNVEGRGRRAVADKDGRERMGMSGGYSRPHDGLNTRAPLFVRWLDDSPWLSLVVGMFPSVIVAAAAIATLPPLPVRPSASSPCVAAASPSCRAACAEAASATEAASARLGTRAAFTSWVQGSNAPSRLAEPASIDVPRSTGIQGRYAQVYLTAAGRCPRGAVRVGGDGRACRPWNGVGTGGLLPSGAMGGLPPPRSASYRQCSSRHL